MGDSMTTTATTRAIKVSTSTSNVVYAVPQSTGMSAVYTVVVHQPTPRTIK